MQSNSTKAQTNKSLLRIPAVQTIVASLLCVLAGLLIGYIVLLFINPWSVNMVLERNPDLILEEFSRN